MLLKKKKQTRHSKNIYNIHNRKIKNLFHNGRVNRNSHNITAELYIIPYSHKIISNLFSYLNVISSHRNFMTSNYLSFTALSFHSSRYYKFYIHKEQAGNNEVFFYDKHKIEFLWHFFLIY